VRRGRISSFELAPGGHPALKSALVRRALGFGLDRKGIARAVLGRFHGESPADVHVLDSVVFTKRSPFYRPNWAGYRLRRAEARRLLVKAGCRPGEDGIYVCGAASDLRCASSRRQAPSPRKLILDLIFSQLRRIGVEVNEEFVPANIFLNTVLPGGRFRRRALQLGDGSCALGPPYYIFGCRTESNYTGYCRDRLTRELRATTRMLDTGARVRALNRIDVELAKDVPVIPLFQTPPLVAMSKRVRGVDAGLLSSSGNDWRTENWRLER
jgi:ABC-type transport system substrate-binding protein